jgi:hypothetical protein
MHAMSSVNQQTLLALMHGLLGPCVTPYPYPFLLQVVCSLEALRGAMHATSSANQQTLLALMHGLLGPCVALVSVRSALPLMVAAVLKLAGDMVEAQIAYLRVSIQIEWTSIGYCPYHKTFEYECVSYS